MHFRFSEASRLNSYLFGVWDLRSIKIETSFFLLSLHNYVWRSSRTYKTVNTQTCWFFERPCVSFLGLSSWYDTLLHALHHQQADADRDQRHQDQPEQRRQHHTNLGARRCHYCLRCSAPTHAASNHHCRAHISRHRRHDTTNHHPDRPKLLPAYTCHAHCTANLTRRLATRAT